MGNVTQVIDTEPNPERSPLPLTGHFSSGGGTLLISRQARDGNTRQINK
jgi:hypothetical protein